VPGVIQDIIYEIRGHRVMLDSDLTRLYEFESLRCQIGTSSEGKGGRRYLYFRANAKND